MTSITWASPRYVQELATILGPQNRTQGSCEPLFRRRRIVIINLQRGEQKSVSNIDQTRLNVQFLLPLNEIVTNFYDELKSITSGYASFDYEDAGYQQSSLVKLGEK